jgi:hypothetical protein
LITGMYAYPAISRRSTVRRYGGCRVEVPGERARRRAAPHSCRGRSRARQVRRASTQTASSNARASAASFEEQADARCEAEARRRSFSSPRAVDQVGTASSRRFSSPPRGEIPTFGVSVPA